VTDHRITEKFGADIPASYQPIFVTNEYEAESVLITCRKLSCLFEWQPKQRIIIVCWTELG
jgi:hypothetical protein